MGIYDEDLDQGRVKPTGFVSPAAALLLPKAEIRMGKPVAYASIIRSCPMTRPTWPGDVVVPSEPAKNTRSPGSSWPGGTRGPHSHCKSAVRGISMPAAR